MRSLKASMEKPVTEEEIIWFFRHTMFVASTKEVGCSWWESLISVRELEWGPGTKHRDLALAMWAMRDETDWGKAFENALVNARPVVQYAMTLSAVHTEVSSILAGLQVANAADQIIAAVEKKLDEIGFEGATPGEMPEDVPESSNPEFPEPTHDNRAL